MVTSIANQEAIERFIRKVNIARVTLTPGQDIRQSTRGPRTSPSEHYRIAASSRQSHDLTVWLGNRRDDPAIEVGTF